MTVVYKTASLPLGFVGVPYEAAVGMTVAGAVSGFALSTGTLPPGVAVSSASDARLVGTPTQAGVYTFKVTANDGGGAVVSSFLTITIYDAPGDEKSTADLATPTAVATHRRLN